MGRARYTYRSAYAPSWYVSLMLPSKMPPNHGLEPTGLISALFNCSTHFEGGWLAKVVSRSRPAAQPGPLCGACLGVAGRYRKYS